ncbi:MAG TPA: amino acid adenylation domain-containing protein, partial [Thermoanaerobaculia bacterium]|nr:amino acid adenylation domain-containing protein [Thermoanaerobaculia bacterium]
ERFQLLVEWNDSEAARRPAGRCLHELFSRQAGIAPDAVALVHGERRLTYGELLHHVRALARRLRALGVGPEVPVGLFAARSPEMVIGLLAVLEAGGAYIPLDPSYPRERLAYLLEETGAAVILTQEAMAADLPPHAARLLFLEGGQAEDLAAEAPGPAVTDLNLAYVIYTSGSTGRPKGVAIQHRGAVALVDWSAGFFPAEDLASVLASTSICFDMSIFELFVPLSRGGRVVLVENALACSGTDARVLNTVPSAAAELLRTGAIPPSVRTVNLGGEPLMADLVRRLHEVPGVERVYNLYGPSEDTTYSTFELAPRGCERVTIGRPVVGTRAYLLDAGGEPVPMGAPGELFLAGEGLARGYLNRPDATAEKFVPDPFSGVPGQRLYRTGDRVRWLPGGSLDFLGRIDHQIKIRGYRVELGEIEALLAAMPGVREAAVVAREGPDGDRLLAAFVAPEGGARPELDDLRDHLRSRLPGFMVPSRFVLLEALPVTATGKVDRRALAASDAEGLAPQVAFAAPATPVEEILAARWAELLGRERVGAGDDFFALGGHSLLATRLATRVKEDFGVELPVSAVFEAPTIRAQARRIEALREAGVRWDEPILRAPAGPAPLSFSQERIWILEQLDPGSTAYHLPGAVRLSGRLDVSALRGSLAEVSRRHEALRTVFSTRDGRPVQTALPPSGVELPGIDLSELAGAARAAALREVADRYARHPFDLEREPGMRAGLVRLGEGEHVLLLNLHHIAADGWSVGILLGEVAALLAAFSAGRPSPLPDLPIQYRDYALWQRGWLRGETLEAQMAFWRERLAAPLPVLELPADRPRAAVRASRGADLSFRLPPVLADGVVRLARSAGATQFMVLLAAFETLLHRHTGQEDLLVGTPVANRRRSEIEPLIGCFINTLVLRTGLAGDPPFSELLRRVRGAALAAYEHQNVPFERLVEDLLPVRDLGHTPLFQVMFMLQNTPAPPFALPGLAMEPLDLMDPGSARFELTLSLRPDGEEGLAGILNYGAGLFDRATIARLAGQLRELLESVTADPERTLSGTALLTAAERHQILREWNETQREGAVVPVHRQFEERARRCPDATALLFRGESLTYRELNRRADRLARHLRSLGVRPEVLVALYAERSLEMVVGILGTLKAGGAYVPLDPAYPRERVATVLDDCRPPFLLTQERLLGRLPGAGARVVLLEAGAATDAPGEDPAGGAAAGNLAYLLYTSGSTGKPKGVLVEHRSVANFFTAMDETLGDGDPGVWLALTSISFDISVLELLWTLTRGAAVVLQEEQRAGSYFAPAAAARPAGADREVELSLFYFASDEDEGRDDKYRLLMEGARFADRNGFSSIWMPERHFHAFGGLYPNPSVLAAAVAAVTERVRIRAGSVVLPLHHPVRVAEEWSVVDNLSRGRVGISFASGWHADDFVFSPEAYADRKEVMCRGVDTVRRLWRGETLRLRGGLGQEVEVRLRPRPLQPELPVWITAAGSPDTFRLAGEMGANLLTHLLFQDLDQVAANLALYRQSWRDQGHPGEGRVTLMLHTFVGDDLDEVRETVRGPLIRYLRTSLDLLVRLAQVQGEKIDVRDLGEAEVELYLERAFDRYFEHHALVGTAESCLALTDRLAAAGVDELGCLIDFGIDADTVLASLGNLASIRELRARRGEADDSSVAARIARHGVTTLQCTPSLAGALAADARTLEALRSLRTLLLGGEALPAPLADRLRGELPGRLVNLYGPTETTVWSTGCRLGDGGPVLIGRPLANTRIYLLDRHLQPVPAGVPGELYIAGDGLARGYLGRPEGTAERFLPEPFAGPRGARMYRTGDLARYRGDGGLEFLGRNDQQVKIRGHRVELGEIEAALARVPGVREAVVTAREVRPGDVRLAAYVVAERPGGRGGPLTPRPEVLAAAPEGAFFRLPNGLLMATLSQLQASLLYREVFEEDHYFRHGIALEDGACVFDVGANIGAFTLLVHQRSTGARVHSFEPIPPTFETLRTNIELYGLPVRLHPVGLAAEAGTAEFTFYPQMAGLSGRYGDVEMDKELTRSIILGAREASYPGAAELGLSDADLDGFLDQQFESRTFTCPLRTLSDVIAETGEERIDLLKVDVERAEVDVLRGIREEDWPKIRQIVLEVDTRDNLREIRSLLADHRYFVEVEELILIEGREGRRAVEVYMVYARLEARPAAAGTAADLRRAAAAVLPEAMVPSSFVFLDALPRTANGKLDRKALDSLAVPARESARVAVAPRNEMERLVAAVWREVLQIESVGVHDSFFEVGGNSLLVTQVRARLGEALGREIPVIELFRHATVGALAGYLAQEGSEPAPALEQAQARAQKLADSTQQSGAVQRQREFLRQRKRQGGR